MSDIRIHQERDRISGGGVTVVTLIAIGIGAVSILGALWILRSRQDALTLRPVVTQQMPVEYRGVEQTLIRSDDSWRELRDVKQTRLESWGQPSPGVVKLPIDVAMELVVRRDAARRAPPPEAP